VSQTVPQTGSQTVPQGVADRPADGVADRPADGVADRPAEGVADRPADGVADGLRDGVGDGLRDGVGDGLRDGVGDGLRDGVGDGLRPRCQRRYHRVCMARLVYSTGVGKICDRCGWPERDCKCSTRSAADQTVPDRIVAKLRLEKSGRGGKTVTVVYDLPRNTAFLKALCSELKKSCGTGGAVAEDTIELQGDLRDRVRELLTSKGFRVKG